jgi:hypothetical protein
MALGAITAVAVDPHNSQASPVAAGDFKFTVTTVVGDSSYPTGGTALTAAQLGLTQVAFAICTVTGSASNNAAVAASYNTSTGKLQMWSGTTLAETASTTNVSGLTVTVIAFGY